MASPFTSDLLALILDNQKESRRPLLFGNARVITTDPLIGDFEQGDVLLGETRIVGIGPGLLTAAEDDGAIIIDCTGFTIVPTVLDMAQLTGLRPTNYRAPHAMSPGNAASFAVLPAQNGESATHALRRFLSTPDWALTVVTDGAVTRWDGHPLEPGTAAATTAAAGIPDERLGTWIDQNDFVHQHLSADGRYDETRGGREHAYQGRFWVTGDRIDYLDDLGFWAFGEFVDDTLHHAGYTFHRA
ncbi:UNVERIFIED_CONTAM: hypothetical protein ABIE34_001645 [Jeotgalibacillus campisalis]